MKQRHDDPQFKFRIPLEMKERLEAAAKENGRTLTAEILQRLTWTLEDHRFILHGPDGPEPAHPSDALEAIRSLEIEISEEEAVLEAMLNGTYETSLTEREKAGATNFMRARLRHLNAKLQALRRNVVEEKIRDRINEAEREWMEKYPDGNGPPSPWQEGIAEYDRLHGSASETHEER